MLFSPHGCLPSEVLMHPCAVCTFLSRSARLILLAGSLLGSFLLAADEPPAPPGVTATLKGHKEMTYGIAFSPDGKYLATGSFDQTVKLWETATGKEIKTFDGPAG